MAGTYKPGDTYSAEFTTRGTSGGANADTLPTASMAHNLVDDGAVTLTVANIDTGRYSVTGTIPSGYAVGDKVSIKIAATVGGVSDKMILEQFVLDSRSADVLTSVAANTTAISANSTAISAVGTSVSTVNTAVGTVNTAVTGVKAKTDQLAFTVSGKVDANALAVGDKTGYSLSATGLDAVAAPADVTSDADGRSSFVKMIRALYNRFYNKVDQTATQQKVYNDAGTLVSTIAVSDNGTTATKGKSA